MGRQPLGVPLEDAAALGLDDVALLELAEEVSRERVGHAERRAGVAPGVLVHEALEERLAVGALVVEHPRALDVVGVVEHQGAALAADEVLGVVEALRGEAADAAERPAAPPAEQAVGVVLDDRDVGTVLEDLADPVEVAGDAGVVNDHDGPHRVVEQLGEVARVGAEGLGLDVAEEHPGALADVGERGADEGEGRHDHRVAGLQVEQEGAHLERRGAGRGEQGVGGAGLGAQQLVDPGRERTRGRRVAALQGRADVLELGTFHARLVEEDLGLVRHCWVPSVVPVWRDHGSVRPSRSESSWSLLW